MMFVFRAGMEQWHKIRRVRQGRHDQPQELADGTGHVHARLHHNFQDGRNAL